MQNKLVIIQNNLDIEKLKVLGINKFLYPLEFFSVGFNKYFKLNEINEENSYLYINRLFESKDLDLLKKELTALPQNIKGIVFDDLGVLEIIKDLNIEKILFNNHFATNYNSINAYLNYVDTVIISPDLTLEETNEILKKAIKPVGIFGYGKLNISYSRRMLNSNYSSFHNIEKERVIDLKNTDYNFLSVESSEGTVIYDNNTFNGLHEKYEDNLSYVVINLFNMEVEEFIVDLEKESENTGFLYNKTIYKLKGGDK